MNAEMRRTITCAATGCDSIAVIYCDGSPEEVNAVLTQSGWQPVDEETAICPDHIYCPPNLASSLSATPRKN